MPLHPPDAGLRPVRLRLDSVQPGKVQVIVPPGDVLEVSADVAGQLVAADPHFVAEDSTAKQDAAAARLASAESADGAGDEEPTTAALSKPRGKRTAKA